MSSCFVRRAVESAMLCLLIAGAVFAAPTPQQRRRIKTLTDQISQAALLYKRDKFRESAALIKQVQAGTEALFVGADEDILKRVAPIYRRLERAHALLELEGIRLPPLKATPSKPAAVSRRDAVTFTKQVAPFLVTKCGRCHVTASRGEFNMSTYVELMRGSSAGVVIFPGDADGSRIVEVIESGDMPRGGGEVSPVELDMLKRWISAGAKFDGDDQRAALGTFSSDAPQPDLPTLTLTKSTGSESISFSRDIAPVLAASCLGCHVNAQRPRGRLNMSNFAGILRGGDSGPTIVPREPARSLLIQRLKGEGGDQRMPAGGRPPLSDEVISKFEKWIEEGASFDGPDVNQNVIQLAAISQARRSTHEQLSAAREQLAESNWQLGMGKVPYSKTATENFLVLGNVGESTLKDYGKRAESLTDRIANILGAPSDQALVKGRMTLFLFKQRYDYSEFGQMVEQRPLPKEWRGHWRFSVVDAYGAMIPPRADEYSWDGLVGQQVAGAYVASLGAPPRWFSEGTARAIAAKIAPRDTRIATWDKTLPVVLGTMSQTDDFLRDRLPAEAADVASFSFLRFLMTDLARFTALLADLRNGHRFDRSFAKTYGASPEQLTKVWARRAAAQAGRRRR